MRRKTVARWVAAVPLSNRLQELSYFFCRPGLPLLRAVLDLDGLLGSITSCHAQSTNEVTLTSSLLGELAICVVSVVVQRSGPRVAREKSFKCYLHRYLRTYVIGQQMRRLK